MLKEKALKTKTLKTGQNCLVNGVPTDYVSIEERGLQYGDGLFETIACEKNQLQFWSSHFLRLQQDTKKLGLVCPPENILLDEIECLVERFSQEHSVENCTVKIIVTRGCSKRGYRVIDKDQLTRIVQVSEWRSKRFFSNEKHSHECERKKMAVLAVCQQMVSINPSLAGIKHLNRLENVLARNEWQDEFTDGLMLDANGYVIEGTMSNIFGIRDGQLLTPALDDSGVAGIVRSNIINAAEEAGTRVEIKKFFLDELYRMDEIFICNSLLEIMPVNEIRSSIRPCSLAWQLDKQYVSLPETKKINQMLQNRKKANVKSL